MRGAWDHQGVEQREGIGRFGKEGYGRRGVGRGEALELEAVPVVEWEIGDGFSSPPPWPGRLGDREDRERRDGSERCVGLVGPSSLVSALMDHTAHITV